MPLKAHLKTFWTSAFHLFVTFVHGAKIFESTLISSPTLEYAHCQTFTNSFKEEPQHLSNLCFWFCHHCCLSKGECSLVATFLIPTRWVGVQHGIHMIPYGNLMVPKGPSLTHRVYEGNFESFFLFFFVWFFIPACRGQHRPSALTHRVCVGNFHFMAGATKSQASVDEYLITIAIHCLNSSN
jgi:hypothetical protein